MLPETYTPQRDMLIRDIAKLLRHAGGANTVELIAGIEGARRRPVRQIVVRGQM
jgi:hypothetical protein